MFKEIITRDNLEKAYLKLAEQMEADGRSGRYAGYDGLKLGDLEVNSSKLIKEARREMIAFKELSPAVLFTIPKKNNPQKLREIYIYNLKERVKAQAIYQIVEPYFDAYFSEWLFSYRSSHQSYFAARSVVRHYKKYHSRDYALVADLTDYSNYISPKILLKKIEKLNFEKPVYKLLKLFIGNKIIKNGEISNREEGIIQGVPLVALFNNLYLDDFDKYCGPRADFYRRVGDDLIIFDQDKNRLQPLYEHLVATASELGLKINEKKTKLGRADDIFNFLGYNFNHGEIGLEPGFLKQMLKRWSSQFDFYRANNIKRKKDFFKKTLKRERNNLYEQFKQIAEQKKLVTKSAEIIAISETFFHILTRYFFGTYTPKNRRLLNAELKNIPFVSIYKHFLSSQYVDRPKKN
ncbi:MAG: reverse transcriptase domain-containing protein [Candidatus Falkowbacteria bacterium]